MDGGVVMAWVNVYEDSTKRIELDYSTTPATQRVTYTNPNEETLRQQARAALAANRTYLALATPTAAQTTAQVKALTRQVQALIRFQLGDLSGAD